MLRLVPGICLLGLLAGCTTPEPARREEPGAALLQWYGAQHDSLLQSLHVLDSLVHKGAPTGTLQRQFTVARTRYKSMEGIVEYFFPDLVRRINGPALPDIRTDDNQVWPPHGFQVLEQYLYDGMADSLRPALATEIGLLQSDLRYVQANLQATTVLPRHINELVQHQVIRVATLGITGFDAPLSGRSLSEAAAALAGLEQLLAACRPGLPATAAAAFRDARTYLAQHRDFNSFDRLAFITRYLMPLSTRILMPDGTAADTLLVKPFRGTLADLMQGRGFDPDYYTHYAMAATNAAKVRLGQQLFSDTRLSKSGRLSCATCHQPQRFFTDGLAKAANKVHGGSLPRNTPTLLYAALQRDQFYDHRSATLEDQVNEVMDNSVEFDRQAARTAALLEREPAYRSRFAAAFGRDSIGGYDVRNAIAAYIRTLSPFTSRFDAYMRGDRKALNAAEIRGFNLFAGKAKCATCHFIPLFNGTVPPGFSKSESEVIGVPAQPLWKNAQIDLDEGRYRWNRLAPLQYAFKTPTVRNSAATAPYMHNGVYRTLDEVVRFYQKGGGAGIGIALTHQTLPFDSLQLDAAEQKALVAFMQALTDKR